MEKKIQAESLALKLLEKSDECQASSYISLLSKG